MTLDPQTQVWLDLLNSHQAPPVDRLTVEQNRAGIKLLSGGRRLRDLRSFSPAGRREGAVR